MYRTAIALLPARFKLWRLQVLTKKKDLVVFAGSDTRELEELLWSGSGL
jgi:hypothetical protein